MDVLQLQLILTAIAFITGAVRDRRYAQGSVESQTLSKLEKSSLHLEPLQLAYTQRCAGKKLKYGDSTNAPQKVTPESYSSFKGSFLNVFKAHSTNKDTPEPSIGGVTFGRQVGFTCS